MNILHIDCSPRQESHSRQLSAAIVEMLLKVAPGASIRRRDLETDPLPHAVADYAVALSTPAAIDLTVMGERRRARKSSWAHRTIVVTPHHNLPAPAAL
ncbi:FMN-dependent NADH-azoreductase [Bradyrhizobium shewense]|uniref:FMN-dependent NADH-azoreductase n=1 Tax=Bradyrhizobium shewense TaxID=1761772 RepID=A0A1C3URT6_9BRAD|nr:NAD(P)H-dependent oxidoreductase [Bradyrhizobium shewense]SCB18047.1 FMN-dependent NADH-azoreductase [Bradyrhizobium shewense]